MAKPTLYLGSDHGGWALKQFLVEQLGQRGVRVTDCGPDRLDPEDDYPVYARAVAEKVRGEPGSLGLLLCRSGQGVAIVANKFSGIRAAVAWNPEVARAARADDDANILALPADFLTEPEALAVALAWLKARLKTESRFRRRLDQILAIEAETMK